MKVAKRARSIFRKRPPSLTRPVDRVGGAFPGDVPSAFLALAQKPRNGTPGKKGPLEEKCRKTEGEMKGRTGGRGRSKEREAPPR